MIISKNITFVTLIKFVWYHIIWLFAFVSGVAALYYFNVITVSIPWLPVSIVGTAVAFYVGFKNNQAYERMWEARKIWGGIVNDSRTWGMMVDSFVSNLFVTENKVSPSDIYNIKKRLMYRHIAWMYAHRSQLLAPTPWEHISQRGHVARTASYFQKKFGIGLLDDADNNIELRRYITPDEFENLSNAINTAAQLINEQGRDLAELREQNLIDDFRHMEMVGILRSSTNIKERMRG